MRVSNELGISGSLRAFSGLLLGEQGLQVGGGWEFEVHFERHHEVLRL